jgi:uncharacterized protein DUF6069
MSTITVHTPAPVTVDIANTTSSARRPLWRVGARAGLLAAAVTTAVAAVALGAGVPLEIDGEQIPLVGFAQMTLMATAVGVLIAKALGRWSATPRRRFVAVTIALTALSVVPDLMMPATTMATRLVLIATHVVAAAVVIPALARRLDDHRA